MFGVLYALSELKDERNTALHEAKSPSWSCLQQCPVKPSWENHSTRDFSVVIVVPVSTLSLEQSAAEAFLCTNIIFNNMFSITFPKPSFKAH